MLRTAIAMLALTACGSSSTSSTIDAPAPPTDAPVHTDAPPIDAPAQRDAAVDGPPPAVTVLPVTCPATVPLTVDAPDSGLEYVLTPPSGDIAVNGIVKFTMHVSHNVVPLEPMTDPGLVVGFNETRCLQFTHAGTFYFQCEPHGFSAAIVVH